MKKGLIIKYILGIMAIVMAVLEIYVLDYGGMWLIVVFILFVWNALSYNVSIKDNKEEMVIFTVCLVIALLMNIGSVLTKGVLKDILLLGGVTAIVVGLLIQTTLIETKWKTKF